MGSDFNPTPAESHLPHVGPLDDSTNLNHPSGEHPAEPDY